MIKCDSWIREQALTNSMIFPFEDAQCKPGVISWGVSSYGYDLRIASNFKVFESPLNIYGKTIDPKDKAWHDGFTEIEVDKLAVDRTYVIIPPNSFALGVSVETLRIPRNILCVCVGKSTYARCGIIVNVTPLEPEWVGKVTIEISNTTPLPARIYANEGICQVLFFSAEEPIKNKGDSYSEDYYTGQSCERSYADKSGKYQDQKGLTMPKVNQ